MATMTWTNLIVLSLISQWCILVDSRLIQHQNSQLEDRYSPDADIESFMKSHNIRYPQQQHQKPSVKDKLQYYYNYEDLPPSLDSEMYRNPSHYGSVDVPLPLTEQEIKEQPHVDQTSHIQADQSHQIKAVSPQVQAASSKVEQEHHIKPQEVSQSAEQQDSAKLKVASRSSAGHVGANEVMAVAPGLPEALIQGEEYSKANQASSIADVYLLAVIAGCAVAAVSGLALTGVCWYRLHKRVKATSDVEYPAYGVTGPAKEKTGPPGDRKLAQSAQMYHYQHQKQQMIASERLGPDNGGNGGSEGESDEECEEGDYTVFECPGLATAGEMEVRNPLFNDQTPVATPAEK